MLDPEGDLRLEGVPVPEFSYTEGWEVGPGGEPERVVVSTQSRMRLWIRDHVMRYSSFATAMAHVLFALPGPASKSSALGSVELASPRADSQRDRRLIVTASMIERMKVRSEARGASFCMIGTVDTWSRRMREQLRLVDLGDRNRFLRSVSTGETIHVPHDTHWNATGHSLYGEALAASLIANELLTPPPGEAGDSATGKDWPPARPETARQEGGRSR